MNAETRVGELLARAQAVLPFGPGVGGRLFARYHRAYIRTGSGAPIVHLVATLLGSLYAMHHAHIKHVLDAERAELHKYY